MKENRTRLIIGILFSVIIVLLIILAYTFVIKPRISGYVIDKQVEAYNQGYAFAIAQIMEQAKTCQQVPLIFGNQTMNVVAVKCLQ